MIGTKGMSSSAKPLFAARLDSVARILCAVGVIALVAGLMGATRLAVAQSPSDRNEQGRDGTPNAPAVGAIETAPAPVRNAPAGDTTAAPRRGTSCDDYPSEFDKNPAAGSFVTCPAEAPDTPPKKVITITIRPDRPGRHDVPPKPDDAFSLRGTPRLIADNIDRFIRRCGDQGVIVGEKRAVGADWNSVWLDSSGKSRVVLSSVIPSREGRLHVQSIPDCSQDGRWVFFEHGPLIESGDATCEDHRAVLPTVVLWDTQEVKSYQIGRGFWDLKWSPDGSAVIYRMDDPCGFSRDARASIHLLPSIRNVRLVSAEKVVAQVRQPSSPRARYKSLAKVQWLGPDRLAVRLSEERVFWWDIWAKFAYVDLIVHTKNGAGLSAEEFRHEPNTPVSLQVFDNDFAGMPCRNEPAGCLASRVGETEVQEFCRGMTEGDAEQFCRILPTPWHVSWRKISGGGKALIFKQYSKDVPFVGGQSVEHYESSELFLMENVQERN